MAIKAKDIIKPIQEGIKNVLVKKLKKIIEAPINAMKRLFENMIKTIKNSFMKLVKILMLPIGFIKNAISTIAKVFKTFFKNLAKSLQGAFKMITNSFTLIIKFFKNSLQSLLVAIKAAVKMIGKFFKMIGKFLKKMFQTIGKFFKKLFDEISKFFGEIFFYIICAVKKMIAFKECALYYFMDCAIFFILLPYRILALLLRPVANLEDIAYAMIDKIDNIVFRASSMMRGSDENGKKKGGFHINQWPNEILNQCYRCKPEDEDVPDENVVEELLDSFGDSKTSFFAFLSKISILIFILIVAGIYIYKQFMQKSCDAPIP